LGFALVIAAESLGDHDSTVKQLRSSRLDRADPQRLSYR